MKTTRTSTLTILAACALLQSAAFSHGGTKDVKLHVSDRWKECSFQLDPSLTQEAWRQFTQEGGLVAYFRPLVSAKPMGAGNYEISVTQWQTAIDDTDPAWNDTFVHPDSTHWLYEGSGLAFPGLTMRAGITDRIDVGVYFTKNFRANYGFWGAQVQYNVLHDLDTKLDASVRGSFVALFGPEDLGMNVVGLDFLASKEFSVWSDWVTIAPYAGVSTYLVNAHETTDAVNLKSEHVTGSQAMVGVVAQVSLARISVEYNLAKVNTLSFKVGVGF